MQTVHVNNVSHMTAVTEQLGLGLCKHWGGKKKGEIEREREVFSKLNYSMHIHF